MGGCTPTAFSPSPTRAAMLAAGLKEFLDSPMPPVLLDGPGNGELTPGVWGSQPSHIPNLNECVLNMMFQNEFEF
jgi:hypothetical protein